MGVAVRRNDLVEDREVTAFDGVDEAANQGLVHFDRCRHRSSSGRRRTPLARGLTVCSQVSRNIAYYRLLRARATTRIPLWTSAASISMRRGPHLRWGFR